MQNNRYCGLQILIFVAVGLQIRQNGGRNSHKPFVMALAAWGIISFVNDEEFKLIVMGVSDKYKRMPKEGYQKWDDNYKTDRLTCERMGKKLDPSMKYLE